MSAPQPGWLCDRHHTWMTFASPDCIECDDDLEHFLPARGDGDA